MQLSQWKQRTLALTACTVVLVSMTALTPAWATNFTRGDTNADGGYDLSDGVNILIFLFGGGGANLPCQDAADANDSGQVDLSDGVFLFTHLFLGGPPPADPSFPTCGVDPTDEDGLGCADYPTCDQDVDPPVIGNLALTAVTDSTATISFETDEPARASLDYGLDDSYGEQQELLSLETSHHFDLTGLDDGTEYHYELTVTDESGNSFSTGDLAFNTVPDRSELGDIGHVLNRLTYGPTADLIARVQEIGTAAYIEEQIDSDPSLDDGNEALESRMADLISEERFHEIEAMVPVASMWRYAKGTEEPPVDWAASDFDDSAWLEGIAGFGYGDGDDNTVLEDMPMRADNPETVDVDESQPGYLSVYLRHRFRVADVNEIDDLLLAVNYDDGFVAYLNGTEVARDGLSGNPPPFNTQASSHEASGHQEFDVSEFRNLLVEGDNVLAVQGHNRNTSSSDMSIHPTLLDRRPDVRPPVSRIAGIDELQHLIHVRGVYSHRQLRAVLAEFWENHFTSDNDKVTDYFETLMDIDATVAFSDGAARREAAHVDHLEYEFFFENAFGYFGDMLLYSATSVPMTIYLDNILNVAAEPNENYAREILELYGFGVDNRYNQIDIEELARCFTGWTICKVSQSNSQEFPLHATNPPTECSQDATDAPIAGTGTGLAGDWRYFKGTEEPSPVLEDDGQTPVLDEDGETSPTWDWAYPDFDDSTWLAGTTSEDEGVGYETGNDDPVLSASIDLSDMRGNYVKVYLRKEFTITQEQIDNFEIPLLKVLEYDDGYVAYVNGIPVGQSTSMDDELDEGPFYDDEPFDFDESTEEGHERVRENGEPHEPEVWGFQRAVATLRPAPAVNVLAIELTNTSLNSSDLSFRGVLVDRVLGPDTVLNRDPSGVWGLRFEPGQHDTGAKTLFEGTPWEINLPPNRTGLEGLRDALDVVEDMENHPSPKEFVCVKLIQKFISDEISIQSVVKLREPGLTSEERDALVPPDLRGLLAEMIAAWETPSGEDNRVGHIATVLRTMFSPNDLNGVFWQNIAYRTKVRTPTEYVNAGLRLLEADLDTDDDLADWADEMGMHLFTRDEPNGWDETGIAWGDTAQYHQRILFNQTLASNSDSDFVWDTEGFLEKHDIATADEIVDFFSNVMFHGTMSTSHRNILMEYVTTDDNGAPLPLVPGRLGYIERVGELVGLLLSMPQWHFQ